VLVYDEPDDGFFVSVGTTGSDAFIAISAGDHETSETLLIPASDPTAAPKVVEPRTVGLRYSVEHWDGRFVILTNADGAIDFKLVEAPVATPGRAHWKDFVAHKPGHFITGLAAYKDHLVRVERVNANTRIVITDRATKAEKPIVIDEEAYVLSLEGGYEFDTPVMRYVYQSPTTPRQWFDYDMATGQKTLRKTQEIPSGHDPAAYVTKRLYAKAPDGARTCRSPC
jgi:oligopeptidase B